MSNAENIIPFKFKPGDKTGNQNLIHRGRPTKLSDPAFIDVFARAIAEGLTNAEMSDQFDISETTVKNYKRDQRVKVAALKYVEDRILRITRRTDAKIDSIVESPAFTELAIEDRVTLLLKIRKEYLGGAFRLQAEGGKVEAETINEALNALEDDPEFAAEVAALSDRLSKKE